MEAKLIRTSTVALSLNYLLKGQLGFLNEHYNVVAVSGQDEHLQLVKVREKVRVVDLKMERKMSLVKDFISLIKLYKLLKKEKPNIVHSITPKAGLITMLAAYLAGVPIRLHTFTGLIFPTKEGLPKKILMAMDKVLCKCATAIYPEGEGVKADLIHYGITKKPLKVIANGNVNGIDVDYFSADIYTDETKRLLKDELNIGKDDFVFIFVGRLVGDKGINELVRAFVSLSDRQCDCKLLLVGAFESDLDPLSSETITSIENNEKIIAVGFQNDVRPYFSISNALAFPSYREGFPNVVMQAGSMGLPSIVTNISGCNEIVIDGKNGMIIPVKDTLALENAMERLIVEVGFKESIKTNARALITSRYKQEMVWNAILAEYKRLEQNV